MSRASAAAGAAGAAVITAAVGAALINNQAATTTPAPPTVADAARLLTQATFGPTDTDIAAVQSAGISGWIDQQEAMANSYSMLAYMDKRAAQPNPGELWADNWFQESFWTRAATGQDQLRQRVQFALSQIFVISLQNGAIDLRGAASYYDMLGANAFGNFRTLLEQVAMHPMMGVYLTSIKNQKENPATGQHPDENFAREVMQLMTLGVVQLNPDGTPKLDANGRTIPTYTHNDIAGLAKVFTGYSWYAATPNSNSFIFQQSDAANTAPMSSYPQYHSISEKDFLGVTIPAVGAASTAEMSSDLKTALDTLFNHPNVGPFISKQLIQRLVTSNPSPAYVGRVAAVFNNNGSGVRGDLKAVVKAILIDNEARSPTIAAGAGYGKLREPTIRVANWIRAFKATSASGFYEIDRSDDLQADEALLFAPSVFNFWRPGYVPPNTRLAAHNLVAPEFQVVNELSTPTYLNALHSMIDRGEGFSPTNSGGPDVTSNYAAEASIATNVPLLVSRLNAILFCWNMSSGLQTQITTAVSAVPIPAATATNAAAVQAAKVNRVKLAILLSMASAEYLTQR
jgi:uncharacterized protein (DUF1800 family)